jgi:predicted nucleic acid-binding protein
MTRKSLRIFLDTSVLIAAVLSPTGGARKLFLLAEEGILKPIVGPTVLRECDDVIRRKAPQLLPMLAQILAIAQTETSLAASRADMKAARLYVTYAPDAHVLAEAIAADPDWFITHDKQHFLKTRQDIRLSFEIGTPGDLIQKLKDDFSLL